MTVAWVVFGQKSFHPNLSIVFGKLPVSKKNFIQNMEAKLRDPDYLSDMEAFLRPGTAFDPKSAWFNVRSRLVDALG